MIGQFSAWNTNGKKSKRNKKVKRHHITTLLICCLLVNVLTCGCADEVEAPVQIIEEIIPQEAFTLVQGNQDDSKFFIIDVRTGEEFASGHLEGAINIDWYSECCEGWIDMLDRNNTYLIYCKSGKRSGEVLSLMSELNFKVAYSLSGGIIQWVEEGFSIIK